MGPYVYGEQWCAAESYVGSDAKTEHFAVREKVGLIDFSSMGKIDVKGKDAKTAIQMICGNDINKLDVGKSIYTAVLNEEGGLLDDIIVFMLSENHYMMVVSTIRHRTYDFITEISENLDVYLTDITGAYGVICLQGPNSVPLLNKICNESIDDIKYFAFKAVNINGREVLLSRTGCTGSRGYELFIYSEDCNDIWDIVTEVGEEFGLKLCGTQVSCLTLPLEKGYLLQFDETKNPYEVGIGWSVVLDKDVPCVANDALKKILAEGVVNLEVGFIMPDKSLTVEEGSPVTVDSVSIGYVTSAGMGWYIDKYIGTAYIKAEYASEGSKITVMSGDIPVEVDIVDRTFFDPEKRFLKGD